MARAKPPEAGVPEWILTYGDMMSLLLCFFIMLYAISTVQKVKVQAAIESLREGFGYQGSNTTPTAHSANNTKQRINSTGRSNRLNTMRGGNPVVAPQGDQARVQSVRIDDETIKGGMIKFTPGSDELNAQAKKDLDTLYDELIGSPFKIAIYGHAAPDEQGPYRDPMDLSYARAINVRNYLVSLGLKRNFFRISSLGPYEPMSRSALPPGTDTRQANSFVEVKMLTDTARDLEGDKTERANKYIDNLPSR